MFLRAREVSRKFLPKQPKVGGVDPPQGLELDRENRLDNRRIFEIWQIVRPRHRRWHKSHASEIVLFLPFYVQDRANAS